MCSGSSTDQYYILFTGNGLNTQGWILASCTEECFLLFMKVIRQRRYSFPTSTLLRSGIVYISYYYIQTLIQLHKITSMKSRQKSTHNTHLCVHPLYNTVRSFIAFLPLISPCCFTAFHDIIQIKLCKTWIYSHPQLSQCMELTSEYEYDHFVYLYLNIIVFL